MHIDRCCYTSQTLWVSTGATPPLTCRIVCRKLICHQQCNESLMKFVFKDRLHFPPPPFWGVKKNLVLMGKCDAHTFEHMQVWVCDLYMRVCVCVIRHHLLAYVLTQSHLWGIWSVTGEQTDTGVRVLFQRAIACWNWKKEKQFPRV